MTHRPGTRQSLWDRLLGRPALPEDFVGELEPDERVLASAIVAGGGSVVLTQLGIWIPEVGDPPVPSRRIGWQWVSKAVYADEVLVLTEAIAQEQARDAPDDVVLIADGSARRLRLIEPGEVPKIVKDRVTASIRSTSYHDVPGGAAVFVQRKVPGQDGITLQVRPDPDTDPQAVAVLAEQVAAKIRTAREKRLR